MSFPNTRKTSAFALATALIVLISAIVVYWQTCFRSVTWWNNAENIVAAVTFGVVAPPGSLLPTVLGWLACKLPLGLEKAFLLNLLAGLLAALTCAVTAGLAEKLIERTAPLSGTINKRRAVWVTAIATALGALVFAYGETLWIYANQFTPYTLTPLFTALILWTLLRWWYEADTPAAFRWLFLIAFLIGLDFSVHRTNAVLIPGIIIWILLRHPKTVIRIRSWLAGLTGLVVGLSVNLMLIPMATHDPYLNSGDPGTLSRYWDYVTLKQAGGGFLMDLFPRKSALWGVQVLDYLTAFQHNLLTVDGGLSVLGLLGALLGVFGLVMLFRRTWRLGLGLTLLLVATAVTTILYFNIPANFFRSFHRHYLPSLTIAALLVAYGSGALVLAAWNLKKRSRWLLIVVAALVVLAAPAAQLTRNFHMLDRSDSFYMHDFGMNMFNSLEQNAIMYTAGDNDTYALWYLQAVEKVRPDVQILNVPLTNTPWYVRQVITRDSTFPLRLTPEEIDALGPRQWKDTTIVLPVTGDAASLGLAEDAEIPDSVYLEIAPGIGGAYILPQDFVLLKVLEENNWRRPIYFCTTLPESSLGWLKPYLRNEGLVQRLMPVKDPAPNMEILRRNVFHLYSYRGYDRTDWRWRDVSRRMS